MSRKKPSYNFTVNQQSSHQRRLVTKNAMIAYGSKDTSNMVYILTHKCYSLSIDIALLPNYGQSLATLPCCIGVQKGSVHSLF